MPETGSAGRAAADERYTALAVASRRRLLDVLHAADGPLDVAQIAAALNLHVTTARFHLHVLERAALVRRRTELPRGPGRPRQLYAPAVAAEANEGHRQLAEVLAGVIAADPEDGARRAEEAGRRWAEDQVSDDERLSWEDGTRVVATLFERLGFAPRIVDVEGQRRQLELDACPFRDVARSHPEVVCSVHLGLLRGALTRLGQDSAAGAARLRPFVEPELCIADIPR